jgi:uncharacterized membrane protein
LTSNKLSKLNLLNLFSRKKQSFFTSEEEERMVEAIRSAELQTSGEIRLFVESKCAFINPVDRAVELFGKLKMYETKDRNAVILYIAIKDKQMAIYGDQGIHQRLGQEFWNNEVALILSEFNKQNYVDGICKILSDIGGALKENFPYDREDINELPDGIVFGK